MPYFRIKATDVYYFTVEASSEEAAIEIAQNCDYSGTKNTFSHCEMEVTRRMRYISPDVEPVIEPESYVTCGDEGEACGC